MFLTSFQGNFKMVCILKAFVAQAQDTPAAACTDVHKLALREWKMPAWHGRMMAASQVSSQGESDLQPAATTSTATLGAVMTQNPQCGAFTGSCCIVVKDS
jgi:hypothetical protein